MNALGSFLVPQICHVFDQLFENKGDAKPHYRKLNYLKYEFLKKLLKVSSRVYGLGDR